ncbi:MAG: hypothetical protein QOH97_3979 [Actinoplanes sp.]|jgi:hypothetical protein|nr:hypothetical protein [Actinoplanes sp.]
MRWFRRGTDHIAAGEPAADADADDRPEVLLRALDELDGRINRQSGRLPGAATVQARWITDTLREIIATARSRPLDIHTILLVRGMATDYLPTTLEAYLALKSSPQDEPEAHGRPARHALLEQLDLLQQSAGQALLATRHADADALTSQGAFLRAKFTRSDLDLP